MPLVPRSPVIPLHAKMRLDRESTGGRSSDRGSAAASRFAADRVRLFPGRVLVLLLLAPLFVHAALPPGEAEAITRLILERKLADAATGATRLVASHPDDAQAHALLGRVRIAQKDGPGAMQAFERARQLAPGDSEIHRGLGDAYASAVDTAGLLAKFRIARECLAAYTRAVELDPANHAARFNLVGFLAGAPALYGGSMAKARVQAAELKRLAPASGHLALGMLHVAESDHDLALAEFEEAVKLDPTNYQALYQIGRLAAMSGKHVDRGSRAMQQALELPAAPGAPGHDAAHWRLGMLHELRGDPAAARLAYQRALVLNPAFANAAKALAKLD